MGNSQPALEDVVWDMRLKSKELKKMSEKCQKEMRTEKLRVKQEIQRSNADGARIFAQNAIRKHHESLNYLKLSSKMDAVASRLETANRAQSLSADIRRALPSLQNVMKDLDTESMTTNMDEFAALFENLDVRSEYVANAIDNTTASSMPTDQVEKLISQVADEHALDVSHMFENTPLTGITQDATKVENPSMQQRMNQLRVE